MLLVEDQAARLENEDLAGTSVSHLCLSQDVGPDVAARQHGGIACPQWVPLTERADGGPCTGEGEILPGLPGRNRLGWLGGWWFRGYLHCRLRCWLRYR